eukprot:scaffold2262_cov312-Prasinococcus_capsulatus_cf.AAC.12
MLRTQAEAPAPAAGRHACACVRVRARVGCACVMYIGPAAAARARPLHGGRQAREWPVVALLVRSRRRSRRSQAWRGCADALAGEHDGDERPPAKARTRLARVAVVAGRRLRAPPPRRRRRRCSCGPLTTSCLCHAGRCSCCRRPPRAAGRRDAARGRWPGARCRWCCCWHGSRRSR